MSNYEYRGLPAALQHLDTLKPLGNQYLITSLRNH